jgi:hypothetical protein
MSIPIIAKFWTLVLVMIFLLMVSGIIYIIYAKHDPEPEPQPVSIEKHISDLEIRAVGLIEKELDKVAK